jgi:hypothetical protein
VHFELLISPISFKYLPSLYSCSVCCFHLSFCFNIRIVWFINFFLEGQVVKRPSNFLSNPTWPLAFPFFDFGPSSYQVKAVDHGGSNYSHLFLTKVAKCFDLIVRGTKIRIKKLGVKLGLTKVQGLFLPVSFLRNCCVVLNLSRLFDYLSYCWIHIVVMLCWLYGRKQCTRIWELTAIFQLHNLNPIYFPYHFISMANK